MAVELARRMQHIRASDIREILKVTQRPEVISFAGGLPAPELFPVAEMERAASRVLHDDGAAALQYSTTEGEPRLRAWVARRMNGRLGTTVRPEEVLITAGSQQGLDLTGKILLDEGDEVLCESPSYLGALQAFTAFQPRFLEVATDDDGMDITALERRLGGARRAKLIYVVPDFQNPSGRCWSLDRRVRFMEVVRRHQVVVIEDNPYGELRYEGEPLPSLKALDSTGQVVHLGTFSKILCPGLRIGWLVAAAPLYEKYVLVKQGTDLHTSTFSQRHILAYLESSDLDASIARMRELYRRRRDTMLAAIDREFPAGIRHTRPQGGLFVWVELPEGISGRAVLARCVAHDVAFVPGGSFFPNGGHENTFRLNFSNMPEERIEEGIRRLGRVLHEALAECADEPATAGEPVESVA